jgi:EAL domain-containing protein (putative c-di-GMP-specific phosphodiesterase class I)/GGDEF domain-containing protein
MSWLELIRYELGPIPMFMWQYAAVLGLLALTLVLTRPMPISAQQAGMLYAVVLAVAGYGISALLHIYLPPPSSAPIRYDLLFLAGMLGGWRGGVLAYVLIFGARLQFAGTVQGVYTGIDMAIVTLGGIWAHHWYRHLELADVGVRQVLWMWAIRSLTLVASGLLLLGLHHLPKEWVSFDLLPYKNSLGSLVRKSLMAGPALLFFASVFAIFRLDAHDRRRQRHDWHSSRKDSLTQLPNRRALSEYLGHNFGRTTPHKMAMISIGVNNHTQMLLAQGHGWGDKCLQRLATSVHEEPLGSMLQAYDVRTFQFTDLSLVLVLKGVTPAELDSSGLANRLHQELSLKMHGLSDIGPAPALNMTVATCDALRHTDAASALRDLGLYLHAHGQNVRNVSFLHTSFAHVARREVQLLASLGDWIDANGPPLAYMPKCDLRTREVLGAEALLRFRDGHGQHVPPGQVLVLAARHKLLAAFEWSTIERVCRDYHLWALSGGARPLSVNISSASLVTADFALRLLELLKRFGLPNEAVVLELTEYDPVPDIDTVRENVRLLHEAGIKLSLDDFGSGHSGLTVLARFPFAELKVDHTMVALIGNPRMRSAIQLALESAQRYNATFVAEGVETWGQLDELHALGITQGQGHLLSREMTIEALIQFAASTRAQPDLPKQLLAA